ncbi:MAG TPA: GntR family transcriptional regulator [Steroidobacteraceae bacterium]|nr:GntR family transcriptional regulator [Steroidobacteraceae bacterium]
MRTSAIKKSATLREQVFDVLLSELKTGDLAPGTRITEEALARRLEVSRTPIREALGQLTRQGILHAREGGGYLVPSPTVTEVGHIIAVRMLLEPPAVRMAAEEYGPARIERVLKAIRAQASAAGKADPGPFARANEEFRRALFGGLANQALSRLIAQFDGHLHFVRAVTLKDTALRRTIVDKQVRIGEVLERRDGKQAQSLWRAYLVFTEEVMSRALRKLQASAG